MPVIETVVIHRRIPIDPAAPVIPHAHHAWTDSVRYAEDVPPRFPPPNSGSALPLEQFPHGVIVARTSMPPASRAREERAAEAGPRPVEQRSDEPARRSKAAAFAADSTHEEIALERSHQTGSAVSNSIGNGTIPTNLPGTVTRWAGPYAVPLTEIGVGAFFAVTQFQHVFDRVMPGAAQLWPASGGSPMLNVLAAIVGLSAAIHGIYSAFKVARASSKTSGQA